MTNEQKVLLDIMISTGAVKSVYIVAEEHIPEKLFNKIENILNDNCDSKARTKIKKLIKENENDNS